MAIKKVLLSKKINNVVYEIFPKTDASVVVYGESTVAAALAEFAQGLANVYTKEETYTKDETDGAIEASAEALYNRIMGITEEDGATVKEAYDTLKEVAAWIDTHGDVATAFSTDIAALKTAVGDENSGLIKGLADANAAIESNDADILALQNAVAALETAMGEADAALQKAIDDAKAEIMEEVNAVKGDVATLQGTTADHETRIGALETTVGDENSGLVKQVNALVAASGNHTEGSEVNGNIKVDGEEVVVYTHPETHAATMIVEDDDHKFVTADEKAIINNAAAVVLVADESAIANERDLYMIELD